MLGDGAVEGEAVGGGVVESFEGLEGVIAEVVEAGVGGDAVAQPDEFVEDVVDAVLVAEAALGDGIPG